MPNFKLIKLIEKKRDGGILSSEEIGHFIDSVVKSINKDADSDEAADRCQIGAMLMACYLRGINECETNDLIQKMKNSGYVFTWPNGWKDLVVDKHSTGGVGDKISLILAPALAALGLKVPMISGRSLGHTGGTLDKLESIPGFKVYMTKQEIYDTIESVGCCIVGQTEDCVPADRVLYECREISATVSCPSLITASIVSKKLSENPRALVYDVKYGKGSIFSSKEEALETAKSLVSASKGVDVSALFTSMENPIGKTVGNTLEVLEAIECMKGGCPEDVLQLTCALGSEILRCVNKISPLEGEKLVSEVLKNGKAMKKFHDMLVKQGVEVAIASELCYGDANCVLPKASYETDVTYSGDSGYISEINPLTLANIWKEEHLKSNFNPGVGFTICRSTGDYINNGEVWIKVHHQTNNLTTDVHNRLLSAISVHPQRRRRKMVDKRVYYSAEQNLITEDY